MTQDQNSLKPDRSTFKILMIDDDVDDIELTREALKECTYNVELMTVDFNQTIPEYLKNNKPQLILLDLFGTSF